MLRIKLVKSVVANTPRNRATVAALGLHRTGAVIYHNDTPAIRGMIHHVKHLLLVEENVEMPSNITLRPTKAKALARKAAHKAAKPAKPAKVEKVAAEKPAKAAKTEKAPAKPAAKKPAAKTTKKESK